jgi:methylmalonyl-CoA mutase C-terminal domain/subunit
MELAPEVVSLLKEKGMEDIAVVLGGTVPPEDIAKLKEAGIALAFGPGTPLEEIIESISRLDVP